MTIRTILSPVLSGVNPKPALDTALAVAAKLGSSIEALYVRPNVSAELAYATDLMILQSIDYAALEQLSQKRAELARLRYESWRDGHAGTRRESSWIEREGLLEEVLERRGRLADLLVLPHPESDHPDTERAFDSGVFGCGRPCLIVKEQPAGSLFGHVLVAWNGSLEGTHAISGAMPILRAASAVTVFNGPEPYGDDRHGQELADALGKHGIVIRLERPADAAIGVGGALLTTAAAVGATLIVMGAYTHSRIRQKLLGGVTRHVLAHATMPLLMAH